MKSNSSNEIYKLICDIKNNKENYKAFINKTYDEKIEIVEILSGVLNDNRTYFEYENYISNLKNFSKKEINQTFLNLVLKLQDFSIKDLQEKGNILYIAKHSSKLLECAKNFETFNKIPSLEEKFDIINLALCLSKNNSVTKIPLIKKITNEEINFQDFSHKQCDVAFATIVDLNKNIIKKIKTMEELTLEVFMSSNKFKTSVNFEKLNFEEINPDMITRKQENKINPFAIAFKGELDNLNRLGV